MSEDMKCQSCDGAGRYEIPPGKCPDCDGTGEHPAYTEMRERAERAEARNKALLSENWWLRARLCDFRAVATPDTQEGEA